MSERLLRFTRNDNVQCTIKVHGRCHCEGLFRSNLPAFIKEIWLRLCRAMSMSFSSLKKAIFCLSIIPFLCVPGCATIKIKEGIFSPQDKNYLIKIPGTEYGWEPVPADKADIALWHKQYKAVIAIISSDVENKGFSMEMLGQLLVLGITGKKIISKNPVLIDNQDALHMILAGEMDDCRLTIDSYIVRIGDKVYDLVCWAPSGSFNQIQADFEDMVRSFHYIKD
ncbi:MAG: hypothetical protein IT420_01865 [Candidatus Brocadia sp.]|nr:hypothetical protein [Candidatus Brocadia sp.]